MTEQQTLQLNKTATQQKLWDKLRPVNIPAASDTYKRTMSGSSELFADAFTAYNLAARRPLQEEGANGQLIVAGLEKTLYPWFLDPVTTEEVAEAEEFFTTKGVVDKFPSKQWKDTVENDGRMPIDIYALPGGQTIVCKDGKHVPTMSVEGPGALVSHLEPHLENAHEPYIHATKAKLFEEAVGDQFAEFGLRSDSTINNHATLMLSIYVGGGFTKTSDDQAVLLFPEYFDDIGTMGHEFIMAYQKEGRTLEEAQELAYTDFVAANQVSSLLPDVISTEKSGLPAILKQIQDNQGNGKIIQPRFDSGDVNAQTRVWKGMTLEAQVARGNSVVEDGYTPTKGRETKDQYKAAGHDPKEIVVGAGGYFQAGCTRDAISLAYKRSATMHEGKLEKSLKFSDSPGKESIPGQIRIYEQGNKLIVAQAEEKIDGKPLMQKVVDNGRVVYNESLDTQRARAQETWNKYQTVEYSPMTQKIMTERLAEKAAILAKYEV